MIMKYTVKNCPKLCGNCAFPQNFHTRKLREITVFFAVIMAKSRYEAILNFPKKYLIWSYLGVTLSTCNIENNFCSA